MSVGRLERLIPVGLTDESQFGLPFVLEVDFLGVVQGVDLVEDSPVIAPFAQQVQKPAFLLEIVLEEVIFPNYFSKCLNLRYHRMYFFDRTPFNRVKRQLFQQPKATLENVDCLSGLILYEIGGIMLSNIVVVFFVDNWRVSFSRWIHVLILLRIFSLKSV